MKDIVLSGSTTTGDLTIGNYIGAMSQWKTMLVEYDCLFLVANLHSLTEYQDPKVLLARTESFFTQYIAMGLDPDKCTLFVQSQVPEHAELQWVLTCISPLGQLERMTQYKDKSESKKNLYAGLLTYPVLMAADILLYKAKFVPVGDDQKQHIELTRDLVDYFHRKYGEVFVQPKPLIAKQGARIMSLSDPTKKMSKSDEDVAAFVSILDDAKVVEKKIKRAVTDSGSKVAYDENNKGVANLMTIYSALTGKSYAQIEAEFDGKMYGHLKVGLAEVVIETLKPIQERYNQLIQDKTYIQKLMKKGAEDARNRAHKTLAQVYEKIGIVV